MTKAFYYLTISYSTGKSATREALVQLFKTSPPLTQYMLGHGTVLVQFTQSSAANDFRTRATSLGLTCGPVTTTPPESFQPKSGELARFMVYGHQVSSMSRKVAQSVVEFLGY